MTLRLSGRVSEVVKIGGELVCLSRLDAILVNITDAMPGVDAAIFPADDARLGTVIHIVVDDDSRAGEVRDRFNAEVMPYERARELHVASIPRSALGKLLRAELKQRFR